MGVNDFFKPFSQKVPDEQNVLTNLKENEKKESFVPWVEKYRPKKVDELVFQEEVVSVLKKCIKGADLPNMLFYGPPGTGKTSAAIALCHQLFPNKTTYKNRVLEMNASDERGIDVVRHRIKEFAHLAVSENNAKAKSIVALKIIILDEADAMTAPAQAALRRTMESESHTTRFFLICNYVTRIIEPLTSRCAKFRFKPLNITAQRERLLMICKHENIEIDTEAIDTLVNISNGDLRKSVTLLQSLASSALTNTLEKNNLLSETSLSNSDEALFTSTLEKKVIDAQDVCKLSGYVSHEEINCLINATMSGTFKQLLQTIKSFCKSGYSIYQVINQIADIFLENEVLQTQQKAKIFTKMAICEKRLLDGADEFLQLLDLLTLVQNCFFESKE